MSSDPADEDPGALLRLIAASAHDLSSRLARDVGLGATDFRALDVLLEHGPAGPIELGRRIGLTPPAATALADRLEAAGHVERIRDTDDRRRVSLVPTDHARAEAWRVVGPFVGEVTEAVAALSTEERAIVSRFLRRIVDAQLRHAAAGEARPSD